MASTFTPEWFGSRWNQARSRAGKRFTEELDVALPLSQYFTAITFANELFERFTKMASALEEMWLRRPFQESSTDKDLDAFLKLVPNVISGLHDLASLKSTAPTALPLLPLASLASESSKALPLRLMRLWRKHATRHQRKNPQLKHGLNGSRLQNGNSLRPRNSCRVPRLPASIIL